MKKSLRWIVLAFCFIPLIVGCSKLKNKVVKHVTDQSPIVYLVNIPPTDSKSSTNPRIYWYGTDPDGYIIKYQYLVIPEIVSYDSNGTTVERDLGLIPKLDGYIDSFFVKDIESISPAKWNPDSIASFLSSRTYNSIPYHIFPESVIVEDSVGSEENVRLFAELDTIKWVSQYIFIRAVDNEDLTSKIWKPDQKGGNVFRRFSRNNHPPETEILWDTTLGVGVYYCLPETTATWKGIKISWEGSDPIDYPAKQPEFLYKWELLGPFEDTLEINPDTSEPIADSSYDSFTNSFWVWDKYKIFVNLKNYGNLTYGWYLFRVRCKDDALVVDETPAYTLFKVIHPYFTYSKEKKVLLVDASNYGDALPCVDPDKIDRVREIYESHLSYVQSYLPFDYVNWKDRTTTPAAVPSPDLETLSLYNLVIVVNYSQKSGIVGDSLPYPLFVRGKLVVDDFGYSVYINYLDVGGKVWFVGTNNFGLDPGKSRMVHQLDAADFSSGFNKRPYPCILGDSYFGLEAVFFPKWEAALGIETNEEFVRAEPFLGALEFPPLQADSARLDSLIWWAKDLIEQGSLVPGNMTAVPGVNYEVITIEAQRIYSFVSFLGPNSEMHERPCGSRFIGSTFKTAEFCFPLFLMKDEQAKEAMKLMIEWFFEE